MRHVSTLNNGIRKSRLSSFTFSSTNSEIDLILRFIQRRSADTGSSWVLSKLTRKDYGLRRKRRSNAGRRHCRSWQRERYVCLLITICYSTKIVNA